jgi:serine O-acetyltransferase
MLLRLQQLSHWLHMHRVPFAPRILKGIIYLVYNCVLPPEAKIGRGTRLWHSGLGIILHPNTEIGENCNIYNHVVFGGGHDGPDGPRIRIVVGNNVNIGAGAKILCKHGTLIIGDNSSIGANAVVLEDVPENSFAVGVPARIRPKASHHATTVTDKN